MGLARPGRACARLRFELKVDAGQDADLNLIVEAAFAHADEKPGLNFRTVLIFPANIS